MSLFTKKETAAEKFAGLDAAASTAASATEPAAEGVSAEQKALASEMKAKAHVPAAAIDPAVMGYLNTAISVAVAEAIKGLVPALAEVGKASRLTREELMILSGKDPEAEQKFKDRLLRERNDWARQEKEKTDNLAKLQANCRHLDQNEKPNWHVSHNFPDRQVRFFCPTCAIPVEPRHWVIDSPEPISGKERSHLAEAHPLYESCMRWASAAGKL